MQVLESIGRDNIKLSETAIEELIALLDKEQILEAEQKIEKAIAKSMKEAEKLKLEVEKSDKDMAKLVDGIHDSAKEIRDIATELGAMDSEKPQLKSEASSICNPIHIYDIYKFISTCSLILKIMLRP